MNSFFSLLRKIVSPWMFVSFVSSGSTKRKNTCTDMERDVLRYCLRPGRLGRHAIRRTNFYGFNFCIDIRTEAWAWISPFLSEILSTSSISSPRGRTTRETFFMSTSLCIISVSWIQEKESHSTNRSLQALASDYDHSVLIRTRSTWLFPALMPRPRTFNNRIQWWV